MRLQVTLALICMLFPKVPALQCYQCIPDTSLTCTTTQTFCTDQCASATIFASAGGQEHQVSVKDCAAAPECVNGSMNLGLSKTTVNTQCCRTDLCNSEIPPALSGSPNGRRCHTCVDNDCTKTLNCEGIEDRCITVHATEGGTTVTLKGCASRSLCTPSRSSIWGEKAPRFTEMSCCEGDLCNRDPGLPLQCYQCIPGLTGTCTDTQISCPDQCGSATIFTSAGGQQHVISGKDCAAAPECISGSMNLGVSKTTINTKCCSTDLCNSQTLPALSGSPNGRRCYTCVGNDCTKTVNCEGIEDRCITVHATEGGSLVTMKGCASRSLCTASRSSIWGKNTPTITEMSCCEGDLCNRDPVQCYQCIPDKSGTCTTTQTSCPDQCASATTSVSAGGHQQQVSIKGCAAAPECFSGSMNLGLSKTTINTKCCSTNLCNSQTLPALSGSPNGRRCYTCVGNDCTNTLNCEGIEDRCIIVHATEGGTSVTMKGCASRSLCIASRSSISGEKAPTITEMSCCKGNMCNSAAGVKLSLLIMLVPLLSSFSL